MFVVTIVLILCCSVYSRAQNSCQGRCFGRFDASLPCQCNTYCEQYQDCCLDFFSLCRGVENCPPISAGDLAGVAQQIYDADKNRVDGSRYKLNFQKRYARGIDNPLPFFAYLDETLFAESTFKLMSDMEDNYEETVQVQDVYSDSEWTEVQTFIENVISTGPMTVALNFLAARGCISNKTEAFKTLIEELWFSLYPLSNTTNVEDSSGFERVFLGELQGHTVLGLNNWLEYYKEEKSGRINYLGWIDYMANPNIVSVSFVWVGTQAPVRSFFVGVSPEFDMAIATLCIIARSDILCPLTINGKSFNYQTRDVLHKLNLQILAAYPIIPENTAPFGATGQEIVG